MVIDSVSLLPLRWLWSRFSPKPFCWYHPQRGDTVAVIVSGSESDEGGGTACVRLAIWAGENGASIGHRSPEVGLGDRPQAEHSWTLHGHSEFTLPLLTCYTKALAACRGGHMQQAAEGEIVLPFGGVGGCCQVWTQRLGLKDVCHRASKAAEFVILHIWRWSFWFQAAGLHWFESVLKKVEFSGFPKEAHFPFAIWSIDANAL